MFEKKIIPAHFYAESNGSEPVRELLRELPKGDREIVGGDILSVQLGWPIGLPVCRPMGNGLYEVRSTISDKKQVRVLFSFERKAILLLHAFVKKSEKTPERELRLARQRMEQAG